MKNKLWTSPLTGTVYYGQLNEHGDVVDKVKVDNVQFYNAIIEKLIQHNNEIKLPGNNNKVYTIKLIIK